MYAHLKREVYVPHYTGQKKTHLTNYPKSEIRHLAHGYLHGQYKLQPGNHRPIPQIRAGIFTA